MLGGKAGNAGELERLFVSKCVADLDRTMIVQADNVTGP
jgi:hypothetical protein